MFIKKLLITFWQISKRPYLILRRNHVPLSSRIDSNCTMSFCTVGDYCYIRSGAQFNHVVIGNYCSFAADVQIGGMEHPLSEFSTSARLFGELCVSDKTTVIGNDVWVAAGAIIRQGVKIGDGAVVGANSFVNSDIPPYAVVAGSPAKIIKFRFEQDVQDKIKKTQYWKFPPKKARAILQDLKNEIL